MKIKKVYQKQRILDFDIENRPLSYWFDGRCTAEITAIATSWYGGDKVEVWLLGEDDPEDMLANFVERYNQADMVTGHYVKKHDLPIINAHLFEYGMEPLQSKLVSDTKLDLMKMGSLSLSQEALASYYQLPEPKHHMDQAAWRQANRLIDIASTRKRVVDDVLQHKALREMLVRDQVLGPPTIWEPNSSFSTGVYQP